jgi:exoribonuclease R
MSEFNPNVVNIFVGILHTSSAISYTTNKPDTIKKDFTPFINIQNKILVKTKRIIQSPDVYVIAKFESIDKKTNIITCTVHEYLDNVGDYVDTHKLLKALSTCHWTRKYDKTFEELVLNDLTPERILIGESVEIYSIDPFGCKDIDDALHCIKTSSGWQVGIHIADVSSYIPEGSIYDLELAKRVETFYSDYATFTHQNMMPNIMSLGHASLLDSKTSRSFSVLIEYDENFVVTDTSFQKTLIKVKENLSYDQAQQLIDTQQNQSLVNLYEFGKKLVVGAIENYDTHKMVEVFMILANKIVAEHLAKVNPTGVIVRTQNSSTSQTVLCENQTLNEKHLNSLYERAIYKVGFDEKSTHSSLGLSCYTHFTSPIRRYVDILVHRELYRSISGGMSRLESVETIDRINTYSKYYKKLQRYTKLLYKIEALEKVTEFEAYIVSLSSDSNQIRVYVSSLEIEIDIKVINKKFSQIIENISENENELVIINTQTANGITLSLFQKITIQIVLTSNLLIPITTTIINPNIQEILNLV